MHVRLLRVQNNRIIHDVERYSEDLAGADLPKTVSDDDNMLLDT